MTTATGVRVPMAKKKTDAGKGEDAAPKMTTMKVDVDLIRKARMVAIYRDQDLQAYVEGLLRPAVEKDYDAMIREEAKE